MMLRQYKVMRVITASLRNGRVAGTSGALKRKTGKSFLIFLISLSGMMRFPVSVFLPQTS